MKQVPHIHCSIAPLILLYLRFNQQSRRDNAEPFAYTDRQRTDRYMYSGKELDRTYVLNLYDFHACQQDPQLGRFTTPDPFADSFTEISPYTYCAADPTVRFPTKISETVNIIHDGYYGLRVIIDLNTEKIANLKLYE